MTEVREAAPHEAIPAARGRGRLLRVLGVGFGLAVIIGNTIAAGILRTPGQIAEQLPNAWLFMGVWVVGGLYALLGAISLAELGTMIPRAGGQYAYSRRALGDYAGFVVGWSDWLSTCGTTAAVAIVIGEFSGVLFPALAGRTVPIALTLAVGFAVLQWRGVKWGSRTQEITSLLKALAFVALVLACFALGGGGDAGAAPAPTPSGLPLLVAIVISLQAVIYTYDGWAGVVYFSEEVEDPKRDIPRSLFGGVLSIAAIYLLVNAALLYVLPISEIAGKDLAAGAAAQAVFGEYGDTIIRSLMVLSMVSGINAYHLMATRVLFGMSRDGLFSTRVAVVNQGGTPTAALFLCTLVAVGFILSGTFEQVTAVLAFFFVANYTLSFISVFVLRRREPDVERPYRAWGYPWTTALALLGSVAFLAGAVASDLRNSTYALLLLALSYPVFLVVRRAARAGGED
jgi:APA family basic amino acid/polyamine antiporter